jgi:hypothetical protein
MVTDHRGRGERDPGNKGEGIHTSGFVPLDVLSKRFHSRRQALKMGRDPEDISVELSEPSSPLNGTSRKSSSSFPSEDSTVRVSTIPNCWLRPCCGCCTCVPIEGWCMSPAFWLGFLGLWGLMTLLMNMVRIP